MDKNKERSVKQINVSLEIGLKGNAGMVDILEAARYLVFLSYQKDRHSLTPVKLQKILYLAQGWSFVWDNKALFPEDFCAWEYGPANEKVYETFKKYGRSEISAAEGTRVLLTKMQGIHWKRCGMSTENEQRIILWI